MDILRQAIPLPIEIIDIIASYDRVLSIKPISKTDCRYEILKTIPVKQTMFYGEDDVRGWYVSFTHPKHLLSLVLEIVSENIYTYINTEYGDRCQLYLWE